MNAKRLKYHTQVTQVIKNDQ